MGVLNRYLYSHVTKGVQLREASKRLKKANIDGTPKKRTKQAKDDIFFLEKGNDSVLEIELPNQHKNIKSLPIRKFADSSVSFPNSIFASKYVLQPTKKIFTPLKVTKNRNINAGGVVRDEDTEFKLLSWFAINYTDFTIKGKIHLYTHREPCLSCEYVIISFMSKYPNISIDLYYEIEYRPPCYSRGGGNC
ncbi:hypothetical protein JJB07_00565 [Tumebacillus sp. ITR2]|uniref:CMP/dCMP-type deaminase domain-containing protein n=1 Tax=Tumebacillus amylolyticus TaxID=2801339 RepID=A0ABS1J630_9BACL|nr:deaminase domain-containing protein [Tumebacillus amylolyticus]MBL0385123.1 hypothetical protein [Tumebacillus amylolyticus]